MSRVNVDFKALNDGRFRALGLALGVPGEFAHDAGLGRMVKLWAFCTENNRHTLEDWEVDAQVGVLGAAAHLVAFKLANETPDGLYIRGTRGRIEWLAGKRRGAKKARESVSSETDAPDVDSDISPDLDGDIQEQVAGSGSKKSSPAQLALVNGAPAVDVRALHDELYATYPAARQEGKGKGYESLTKGKAAIKTPDDAQAFREVIAAQAAEGQYAKAWFRACRDWRDLPRVSARASPVAAAQSVTVGQYRHTGNENYANGKVDL